MISLADKRIFITGSSRGLGLAAAQTCALAGAKVVLHGRDADRLNAAQAQLAACGAPAAGAVRLDLADKEATRAGVREALALLDGKIDGFVHAAGILDAALLPMADLAKAEAAFRVNVLSGLQLAQPISRLMARDGGGSIVFFSSVMARKPDRGLAVYAATKGAVESMTLAMARELAPQKVRVNAVAPGLADTDMARAGGGKVLAERLARVPMGAMTSPSEIAHTCAFLLSDLAPTLTGQIIGVDGGMSP